MACMSRAMLRCRQSCYVETTRGGFDEMWVLFVTALTIVLFREETKLPCM